MFKEFFGTKGQISFDTENDYYETVGFLAKSDGTTSFAWEDNDEQGAWGKEGRIQCYKNISSFPSSLSRAFTAGTGGTVHRINCNEFVHHLRDKHKFTLGKEQNHEDIRLTIPTKYIPDFERGLSL